MSNPFYRHSFRRIIFILIAFLSIALSGCAPTMFNVNVKSDPEGADVKILNNKQKLVFTGKTPAVASLVKHYYGGDDLTYMMQIYKFGYAKKTLRIAPFYYFNGACVAETIGDTVFLLPIWILSARSGSANNTPYTPFSSCGSNAFLAYHTHLDIKLKRKKWPGLCKSKSLGTLKESPVVSKKNR
ncbi:MAG: hypothetical protein M1412_08265 [Deltaproteobacteria bacterium]|nr:hypothetical protein [Deltaproteobacteria bacterium]MCL5893136.1 hypothetical protein [Deltaproteobacteria bacterium]